MFNGKDQGKEDGLGGSAETGDIGRSRDTPGRQNGVEECGFM